MSEREGRRTEGASGYQNQKQKPHKSMWGIKLNKTLRLLGIPPKLILVRQVGTEGSCSFSFSVFFQMSHSMAATGFLPPPDQLPTWPAPTQRWEVPSPNPADADLHKVCSEKHATTIRAQIFDRMILRASQG